MDIQQTPAAWHVLEVLILPYKMVDGAAVAIRMAGWRSTKSCWTKTVVLNA
jgi:hypothetical protein